MMYSSAFQEQELITRKMKVGNEWQTKVFPVVGGRLRLAHENHESLSIQTEIIQATSDAAIIKATVTTSTGTYHGTGTASAKRDERLSDTLIELAETRAIARALRFSGFGVEYTSAEEVSHVPGPEGDKDASVVSSRRRSNREQSSIQNNEQQTAADPNVQTEETNERDAIATLETEAVKDNPSTPPIEGWQGDLATAAPAIRELIERIEPVLRSMNTDLTEEALEAAQFLCCSEFDVQQLASIPVSEVERLRKFLKSKLIKEMIAHGHLPEQKRK